MGRTTCSGPLSVEPAGSLSNNQSDRPHSLCFLLPSDVFFLCVSLLYIFQFFPCSIHFLSFLSFHLIFSSFYPSLSFSLIFLLVPSFFLLFLSYHHLPPFLFLSFPFISFSFSFSITFLLFCLQLFFTLSFLLFFSLSSLSIFFPFSPLLPLNCSPLSSFFSFSFLSPPLLCFTCPSFLHCPSFPSFPFNSCPFSLFSLCSSLILSPCYLFNFPCLCLFP